MSDPIPDPLAEELAVWIRNHPEVWPHADASRLTDEQLDQIVDSVVTSTGNVAVHVLPNRRRRRRAIIGGTCAVFAVAGGVAAAAALSHSSQPTRPESGALCLRVADLQADAIALSPGADPIAGCRQLWQDGRFDRDGDAGAVPPLVACIGPAGSVWVFPGEEQVCADLGLVVADPVLSPDNAKIVALQDRLVAEINMVEVCLTPTEAVAAAERILAASGLSGWHVVLNPDATDAACVKAGVDSSTLAVSVFEP